MRLLLAFAISLSLHLALIYFPARHADRGLAHAGQLPEWGASTPLSVILAPARADLPSVETDAGLTSVDALPEVLPVAASPVAASTAQPAEAGGSGGLPVGPDLIYYTTDKLSKSPEVIAMDDLNTPETRVYKVSGALVMNLWIDDQGKVTKALVEDSALPPIFAETATRIFMAARFSPGERHGQRVGTLMRIEVGYEDKGLPVAH